MNKSKRLLKTNSRLGQLESMVVQSYSVIWDCCCDHGLLGMSLLKRKRAGEVIFVDVITKQMEKLEKTLTHMDDTPYVRASFKDHPPPSNGFLRRAY